MKIRTLSALLLAVSAMFSSGINAATTVPLGQIQGLRIYDKIVTVKVAAPFRANERCTNGYGDKQVWIVYPVPTGANTNSPILPALITAHSTGEPVGFGVAGCYAWGDKTYSKVYRIDFQR